MKQVIAHVVLSMLGTSAQRLVTDRNAWFSNLTIPFALPNLMPTVPYLPAARMVVQSSLNAAGDSDYFRFQNVRFGEVRIYSTGSTDVKCTVFLTDGALVAENDNASGDNSNFAVMFNATDNTQYVVLVQGSNSAVTGDYDIVFITSATDDVGNDLAEALEVSLPDRPTRIVLSRNLEWKGDRDFYKFTPPVNGYIIFAASSGFDTVANFFGTDVARNINSNLLASNDDTNGVNYHITYHLKAGTQYWLDSGSYSNSHMGPYTVTVHFLPGDVIQPVKSFINHTGTVTFLHGDAESNTLFSASFDRSLRRFNLDGVPIAQYGWHGGLVWAVLKLSQTRVLSGGCDGSLKSGILTELSFELGAITLIVCLASSVMAIACTRSPKIVALSTGTLKLVKRFGSGMLDFASTLLHCAQAMSSQVLLHCCFWAFKMAKFLSTARKQIQLYAPIKLLMGIMFGDFLLRRIRYLLQMIRA